MRIISKRQISIPKKIMDFLGIHPGDEVEFHIEENSVRLIPIKTIKIPRDQAWFWTDEWQVKEREAEEDLSANRYRDFETLEDLLNELHGED